MTTINYGNFDEPKYDRKDLGIYQKNVKDACPECKKELRTGTPALSLDGRVLCHKCKYESEYLIRGVDQNDFSEFVDEYVGDGVTIWGEDGDITDAWIENGGTKWTLTPHQKQMDVRELWYKIRNIRDSGAVPCSHCGDVIDREEGTRSGFAGVSCPDCYQDLSDNVKNPSTH